MSAPNGQDAPVSLFDIGESGLSLGHNSGVPSEPMPMPRGIRDAVHLATALIWRDRIGPLHEIATHGMALGSAARAFGFDVRGL
jgi:hypothetical protein